MSKFKVGEKVVVYDFSGRFTGTLTEGPNENGSFFVSSHERGPRWVHEKQCRKLVKKERRRVFLTETQARYYSVRASAEQTPNTIEFVEVRKRK